MIDLEQIGRYRENNRIEAKKAAGGFPRSLWETYSAFANTIGGLILLGVEESRAKQLHITGVPDGPGYVQTFWRTINDPARVSVNILRPHQVTLHSVEGRQVMVVAVPRAGRRDQPVYLGDSPFSGSYRRDGEGDYHCSPDQVRAMLRDRGDTPADLAVLEGCTPADLSMDTLRQFRLLMAMRRPEHPWNFLADEQFLPTVGILGRGGDGAALHPTLAGLLFLGRRGPLKRVFPNFFLEYREPETGFFLSSSQQAENLFTFYRMVSRCLSAAAALSADPAHRQQLSRALGEAALNAILHADYFGRGGLHISRTADALSVTNDGLLRVPPEDARQGGRADPRNVVLARLFALVGIGSGKGRGLKGIYDIWAQQGWSAPVLSESFRADTTHLSIPLPPRDNAAGALVMGKLVEYLTDHISATAARLSGDLSLDPALVSQGLSALLERNLVVVSPGPEAPVYTLRA